MMNVRTIAFLSVMMIPSLSIAKAASPRSRTDVAAVVNQFSPEFRPSIGEIHKCFATLNAGNTKDVKTIIAAYADDQQGRVRLLTRSGIAYILAYDMEIGSSGSVRCSVEPMDVDGDGRNEAKITFASARGELRDWILKLQGNQLINLGPTGTDRNGRLTTLLSNSALLDIRHDGTRQIISSVPQLLPQQADEKDDETRLYVLENGRYVPAQLLLFHIAVANFEAGAAQLGEFNLAANTNGTFDLVIAGQPGTSGLLRGTIAVNGIEILSHQYLRDGSVHLKNLIVGTNQIAVTLDRDDELSTAQNDATGILHILVLRDFSSQ